MEARTWRREEECACVVDGVRVCVMVLKTKKSVLCQLILPPIVCKSAQFTYRGLTQHLTHILKVVSSGELADASALAVKAKGERNTPVSSVFGAGAMPKS